MPRERIGFVEQGILDAQQNNTPSYEPKLRLAIAARMFALNINSSTWALLVDAALSLPDSAKEDAQSDQEAWDTFRSQLRNALELS